jgi:hypothetical protein
VRSLLLGLGGSRSGAVVATGAPSLAKVAVCGLSLPGSACASAFNTRSLSFLVLLIALDVHMKGRSILSGLRAEGD